MDCNMPVMDGYTASRTIKKKISDKEFPKMTIVAATAYAFNENIQKVFDAGMDDYLSKPLSLVKVKETVDKVLKIGQ